MKKALALIAILAISLSVCACTGNKEETTAGLTTLNPATTTEPVGDVTGGDKPSTTKDGNGDSTAAPTTPSGTTANPSVADPDDDGWGELIPLE